MQGTEDLQSSATYRRSSSDGFKDAAKALPLAAQEHYNRLAMAGVTKQQTHLGGVEPVSEYLITFFKTLDGLKPRHVGARHRHASVGGFPDEVGEHQLGNQDDSRTQGQDEALQALPSYE
jgi:hypothetical protein